jgi:hypothetical protein
MLPNTWNLQLSATFDEPGAKRGLSRACLSTYFCCFKKHNNYRSVLTYITHSSKTIKVTVVTAHDAIAITVQYCLAELSAHI